MPDYAFALTDHICGACLARILHRETSAAGGAFRCSNCGAEADVRPGLAHPPICVCAAKLGTRDAGIRCVANPNPRPELLCEVVAMELHR